MKKKTLVSILLCACIMASVSFTGCSKPQTSQTAAESSLASSESTVSTDDSKGSDASEKPQASDSSDASDKTVPSDHAEVSINSEVSDETSKDSEKKDEPITIDNIRSLVVGIDEPIELKDGTKRPLINFDNAATTPVLKPVEDEVNKEFEMYGSIGRGFSAKSNHSTDVYNDVRDKVISFVGAKDENSSYTAFYVNNTTDGLNKLASALIESKDDIVLTTRIEHHANDLCWRERCNVVYAEVDEQGRVIYDDIERLLKENNGKIKYVSVTAASNVTGYVTDVHRVAKMAHQYGAKIIVDGAQIVAHRAFSMIGDTPEENIDFFVFSAHKMYSPYGGGTVNLVTDNEQYYKQAPAAYEAGSPNYPGVVGLGKAIDILQEVGFDNIEAHEKALNKRLVEGLKKLDNVIIYGDSENLEDRVGVVTFNFSDINSYILAYNLSERGGVATRRGAFCAHPYVWRLMDLTDTEIESFASCTDVKTAGMVRISFGIYNTEEEVDQFLAMMPEIMKVSDNKTYLLEVGGGREYAEGVLEALIADIPVQY